MAKIAYYGSQLSPNMIETAEGYLCCTDAVIARSGFQSYKGEELRREHGDDALKKLGIDIVDGDEVQVFRPAEEVFNPDTISSFESKAFTDNHPDGNQFVTVDNDATYRKGHIQNVRKGTEPLDGGDWPLLADIIVTDAGLITKIRNGQREISCGYGYDLAHGNGKIFMQNILGNHAASVPKGRAGSEARINDAAPAETKASEPIKPLKKEHHVSNRVMDLLGRGLKALAADSATTPEELAEAAGEVGKVNEKPAATDRKSEDRTDDAHAKDKAAEGEKAGAAEVGAPANLHAALDSLYKRSQDKMAKDKKAQDVDLSELKTLLGEFLDEEASEGEHAGDGEEEELEEGQAEAEDKGLGEEEGLAADKKADDCKGADKAKAADALVTPIGDLDKATRKPTARAADAANPTYMQGRRDGINFTMQALKPHVVKAMRRLGNDEGRNLGRAFDTIASELHVGARRDGKGSYGGFGAAADTRSKDAQEAITRGRAADQANQETNAAKAERVNKMYADRRGRPINSEVK